MPAPPWVWPPALSSISTAILDAIYARLDGTNQPFTNDIAINPGSLEIDAVDSAISALEIAHTWNNGAFVYESVRANVTNTASAAGSLLLNLLVGGVSKFMVSKAGGVTIDAGTATAVGENALKISQTWNNAAVTFNAVLVDITNTVSAATAKVFNLRVGGSSVATLDRNGLFTLVGGFWLPGGGISISGAGTAAAGQIRMLTAAKLSVTDGNNIPLLIETAGPTGANTTSLLDLTTTWNTTGAPSAIKANVTDTASAAASLLLDLLIAGASKFSVSKAGNVAALKGTAIPAGGTAGVGYSVSSTANFGVYFGSGAPSLSAAKGSLYLRSDGSGINDRCYVNTDGATTWTAIVTVA